MPYSKIQKSVKGHVGHVVFTHRWGNQLKNARKDELPMKDN